MNNKVSALVTAGILAGMWGLSIAPASAMPSVAGKTIQQADAPVAVEKAWYCGWRCRHGYYGYRAYHPYYGYGYRPYYRPYYGYRPYYYGPHIGIGIGGVGIY